MQIILALAIFLFPRIGFAQEIDLVLKNLFANPDYHTVALDGLKDPLCVPPIPLYFEYLDRLNKSSAGDFVPLGPLCKLSVAYESLHQNAQSFGTEREREQAVIDAVRKYKGVAAAEVAARHLGEVVRPMRASVKELWMRKYHVRAVVVTDNAIAFAQKSGYSGQYFLFLKAGRRMLLGAAEWVQPIK
jgi:hypothetical protein